jgi:hypothetical protein
MCRVANCSNNSVNASKMGFRSSGGGASRVIETERYRIEITRGVVKVFDKESNTHVRVWGDPHVHTSDGDKMQFQKDNLTLELKDGTKITIKPTAMRNGVALVDSVLVLKGNQSAVVKNVSGTGDLGLSEANDKSVARQLDLSWDDGTVLTAGEQVDDLFAGGREYVGGDSSQNFGEHLLDGVGGRSSNEWAGDDKGELAILDRLTDAKQRLDELKQRIREARNLPTSDPSRESILAGLDADKEGLVQEIDDIRSELKEYRAERKVERDDDREGRWGSGLDRRDDEFDTKLSGSGKYDRLTQLEDEIESIDEQLQDPNLPEGTRQRLLARQKKLQSTLELNRTLILAEMEREKKKVDAFVQALQRLA